MASESISRSTVKEKRVRQGKKKEEEKKRKKRFKDSSTVARDSYWSTGKGTFALLTMLIYLSRRGYQKYRMPKVCQYVSNTIE